MDSIKLTFNTPNLKKLKTVYIVEDNAMESDMLTDYFSKYANIKIKTFPNGDDCVKDVVISKVFPDLILIDYFLDSVSSVSKDGLEVLTKLKEISPNSEIIMHTSVDNERIMQLAKKKGALAFVGKGRLAFEKLDAIIKNNFSIEVGG